jgi:hypothetical protein
MQRGPQGGAWVSGMHTMAVVRWVASVVPRGALSSEAVMGGDVRYAHCTTATRQALICSLFGELSRSVATC